MFSVCESMFNYSPSCFIYSSFSHLNRAKPVLLQMDSSAT